VNADVDANVDGFQRRRKKPFTFASTFATT